MEVKALDAAQSFDHESRAAARITESKKLKIGIVGFGTFGQFLARRIILQGHKVRRRHFVTKIKSTVSLVHLSCKSHFR